MKKKNISVGVLAFQGGVEEHISQVENLGISVCRVVSVSDMKNITHLILPGGESTVMGKYMENTGLDVFCKNQCVQGKLKLWGTCAGAILLGKKASLARNAPFALSPAFRIAIITESTLDIWPAPIPTVFVPCDKTIALLLTNLTTFHPKNIDAISCSEGLVSVTILRSLRETLPVSASCTNIPPGMRKSAWSDFPTVNRLF